ncbi:DUF6207 family protein [Streptomyces sp. NPDC005151]
MHHEVHVTEPGLAVVEVAACDDQTTLAVQELLAPRDCTAPQCSRRATAGDHRRRPALRPRCHRSISVTSMMGWVPLEVKADQPRCVGERRAAPVPPVVPGGRALA